MIRSSRATLSIYSDVLSVADVTAMLGIEPDNSGDMGTLTRAGRAGRDAAPERLRHQRTFWSVTEKDDGDSDDATGFAALRRLVQRVGPIHRALATIRESGETVLWWSGDSDSSQGGFVLEADLISDVSRLGCDIYGTAFLLDGYEAH
ncbi:hypothetical protein SK224_06365 [Microbacterium sp. BG28]|uniref:hypothetical protein n=1 Tax=Microbacterium sp. BG28 TaxID=3097356 RepID=UPI002A59B92A|nr:hypothetical protein [Microbacterium sp. BG28]MDY0828749.1 hypothetical protein [Microbacterium sp. BG28]